jgi:hypothetical protein
MNPIPIGTYADITYEKEFTIDEFERHLNCVGVTGTGKTTLFGNIFRGWVNQGYGASVLDPHGGLADLCIDHIPKDKTNLTWWFAPADEADRDMGLNIYDVPGNPAYVVEQANKIFDKLFGFGWGPASAQAFRNGSLALFAQNEKPTLAKLQMFYYDDDYRKHCLKRVTDRIVLHFFRKFDEKWPASLREDRIAPLMNKLDALLSNDILRRIFSQQKTSIPIDTIQNTGGILICKLPSGLMTEDGTALVGSIISSLSFQAALRRQKLRGKWLPHMMMLDEYRSFTHGTSIQQFLEQTRKYKVFVVTGVQSLEGDENKHTLLGAPTTKIFLRVGYEDAESFRKETATDKRVEVFQNLYTYYAYVRKVWTDEKGNEAPTGPDRVRLYPSLPKTGVEQDRKVVIKKSLEQFGIPRALVEERIQKFLTGLPPPATA